MSFLETIKPYLISEDILIQETVLHAIHDYPFLPNEWTNELLKEAFNNNEKLSSILIYIDHQTFNEEALQILVNHIPTMDKSRVHLAINLLDKIEPSLVLRNMAQLKDYLQEDVWSLYMLLERGMEEEVLTEYGKTLSAFERADSYQHDLYIKAKKLAACIVKNGWITEDEIDIVLQEELNEQWFSLNGILTVYMIGLLGLDKYIPFLSSLLLRDEDTLLEEVAEALIRFQSDKVVEAVSPYLKKGESIIFATSIIENIKTDKAVESLREAYRQTNDIDDQDLIIEALCHQLSIEAFPEINEHMEKGYLSHYVDLEMTAYSYCSILGLDHPEIELWREAAMERETYAKNVSKQGSLLSPAPIRNDNKVGRNDPCPCGSGKKYKKCCGK
jgi:hypothetical protein